MDRIPWRGIALAQLFWFGMVALLALQRAGYWTSLGREVPKNVVILEVSVGLTWGLLLPAIALASLQRPLGRDPRGWGTHGLLFVAAAFVEAIVYVFVDGRWLHVITWSPVVGLGFLDRVRNTATAHFMASVQFFGVIVGVTQAHLWRQRFEDRRLREARLEAELARSQLQVLRSELDPHFLFNALNTVSTLMHRDVAAADTMLARIGDLLRTSLESKDTHEVPLREEVEFLERYLDIERVRFGDRIRVTVDVTEGAMEAHVPRLFLQPLVENALRHGVGPRRGPGTVDVRAWRAGGSLRVVVADDGLGAEAPANPESSGIGLANTRRRLRRLYGREHRFRAAPLPAGGFRVSLRLPFHTGEMSARGIEP